MKAVLKMSVSDGATLEFNVIISLHKGVFKTNVEGQSFYTGEGETVKASVNNLLYKMADITAQDLDGPTMSTAPRAG